MKEKDHVKRECAAEPAWAANQRFGRDRAVRQPASAGRVGCGGGTCGAVHARSGLGDPLPESVVLWTRLAPELLHGGGMPDRAVPVEWELAADEGACYQSMDILCMLKS